MEFSVFFNKLKIETIYSDNPEKLLVEFKRNCETEQDFIQLYELKNILEVVNIFNRLHKAYLVCSVGNIEPLFNEIELLSNMLEDNSISCYSYAYYFYAYLFYIYHYDKYQSSKPKGLENYEIPEKIEWCDPNKFDYSKLNETTFGVNASNDDGLTKSFPNYKEFVLEKNELVNYKGSKPYVIIPDTILAIRKSAFRGNKRIKMVIIPDTVNWIDEGSFEGCEGLNLVHLSRQIKKIPDKCFSRCKRLKYIVGENIYEVGKEAFNLCVSLKEINLDSLAVANDKSFYGCVGLINFDFVSNLSHIGDQAFTSCKIKSLFLNDCDYLGSNSFSGCVELAEVIINNDIENLGETPLYCCNNITKLEVRDNISFRLFDLFAANIEEFNYCKYKLSNVKLATISPYICWNMKSLTYVEIIGNTNSVSKNAFQNCENLTSIKFSNSLISEINDYAFDNCISLTELNINFDGTAIGESSFYNCSNIRDFSFLNSVVSFGDKCLAHTNLNGFDFYNRKFKFIGKFAFANSYFPEDLNIRLDGADISVGAFHGVEYINCFEIFNCDIDSEYFFAMFERTKDEFINNVTILSLITDYVASPYLFSGFNSSYIECKIENMIIPEGLFSNCVSLCSVKLNGLINNFGAKSFKGCKNLDYIDAEIDSKITVSEGAFMDCACYEYPYFVNTSVIEDYAFYGSKITDLSLNDNVKYIGDCAFGNCNISNIVKLPFVGNELNSDKPFGVIFAHDILNNTEVQIVNENKYYIPKNIECVEINSELISDNAFMNCYFIKKIDLPNVCKINDLTFHNCTSLTELSFGEKLEKFNAICLFSVSKDIQISIDVKNNSFSVVNGSVYSKDCETIYYASNGNILNSVKKYKPYSVMNYDFEELRLDSLDEIDNNAFDIKNVKKILINDVEYIVPGAFVNSDNLNEISIASTSYNEYDGIFVSQKEDINLSKMVIDNISIKSIKNIFKNANNLNIHELYILNSELEDNSFDGISTDQLSVYDCIGSANCNSRIKNVYCERCKPFNDMFIGDIEYDYISIITNEISENDVAGIKCNKLDLRKVYSIKKDSFKDSVINTLSIYNVNSIDEGAFYKCKIENINIYDSSYICDDNCIYKDDQLLFYRPTKSAAKIPSLIKRVCSHSIDLINVSSLEIASEVIFENQSTYNSSNVQKITCDRSNLTRIADLFDDASNIKELTFNGDVVPNKYLSRLSGVEKIYLKSSIKSIGDFAFSQNCSLKQIFNFEKANDYGDFIFMGCKSLEKISFNEEANSIGYHVVDDCVNLKKVELPLFDYYYDFNDDIQDVLGDGLSNTEIIISKGDIPAKMFMNLNNSIIIKQSPSRIGYNAFTNTSNISINLNKTKYIGSASFKNSTTSKVVELKDCEYIGESAFENCNGIKEFYLFDKLKYIGDDAFNLAKIEKICVKDNLRYHIDQNCLFDNEDLIYCAPSSNNSAILFNQKIERIHRNAFTNCEYLKSVKFDTVRKYDNNIFINCSNLEKVDLGVIASEMDGAIFVNCKNVSDLSIYQIKQGKNNCLNDYFINDEYSDLNTVEKLQLYSSKLSEGEIACNNSLEAVILNDSIQNIPNKYFSECRLLSKVNIPSSCEYIGDDAFNGCKSLAYLDTYNTKVKKYGARSLASTDLKELKFNKNVEFLGESLLLNTPIEKVDFECQLKNFTCEGFSISDTLKEINFDSVSFDKNAFEDKIKLKSVTVNNYLSEEIPNCCFKNCTDLIKISIPNTYRIVRSQAYANCSSLPKIIVESNVIVEKNAFENCRSVNEFIYNPHSDNFRLDYFGFSNDSMLKRVELNDSILAESAFANYINIENVLVHPKQNVIPVNCFKNCSNLKLFTNDGFKSISPSAFEGCCSLKEFDLKECENIDNNAFTNCKSIISIRIPKCVKNVGKAFVGCEKIERIEFENEISTFKISNYGFVPGDNLKEVVIKNGNLAVSAFEGFNNIRTIEFGNDLIDVPSKCFAGCTNLNLAAGNFATMKSIGDFAFTGCDRLDKINLPNIESLGKNAFENCTNIQSISFGDKLKVIPDFLCSGCSELTVASMKSGIEKIGKNAFSKTRIKVLDIYSTIKYVDSMIFYGNKKSVDVIVPDKKFDTSKWAKDWNLGFVTKHKIFRFFNPKVSLKARR